eukprot:scaffold25843_cov112-Isochrysis_galbana.AAC.2
MDVELISLHHRLERQVRQGHRPGWRARDPPRHLEERPGRHVHHPPVGLGQPHQHVAAAADADHPGAQRQPPLPGDREDGAVHKQG